MMYGKCLSIMCELTRIGICELTNDNNLLKLKIHELSFKKSVVLSNFVNGQTCSGSIPQKTYKTRHIFINKIFFCYFSNEMQKVILKFISEELQFIKENKYTTTSFITRDFKKKNSNESSSSIRHIAKMEDNENMLLLYTLYKSEHAKMESILCSLLF